MTGAIFVAFSALIAVAASFLAWAQVRRVQRAVRSDIEVLAAGLKRVPAADRPRALLARSAAGSFEHELAREAMAAPDEEARIAAVNLALAEVEHALAERAGWPTAALRIALLGAGLAAFLAYVAEPGHLRAPLAALAVGGLGALGAAEARRTAANLADRQRRAVDALVAVVFALPDEPRAPAASSPARGRRRRGSSAR